MYRDSQGRQRRREKVKTGEGIPSPTFNGPCKGKTDLFYRQYSNSAESRALVKQVKAICGMCKELMACREWAIKHEEFGVWGAMTEQERRAYRINHNIVLIRPEALTIETVRVNQTSRKISVELPEPELEQELEWPSL